MGPRIVIAHTIKQKVAAVASAPYIYKRNSLDRSKEYVLICMLASKLTQIHLVFTE